MRKQNVILFDTFNKRILSQHRTVRAAVQTQLDLAASLQRGSYLPTAIAVKTNDYDDVAFGRINGYTEIVLEVYYEKRSIESLHWCYDNDDTERSLAYMQADNDGSVRHLRPYTDADRGR